MILAEASNAFMGSLVWAVIGLLGGGASVAGILAYANRNEKRTRQISPQPLGVKVSAKRYNHDLAEERYQEVTRRLDAHDEEIAAIQRSRAESMEKINCKFERILIALAEIGAQVGGKTK